MPPFLRLNDQSEKRICFKSTRIFWGGGDENSICRRTREDGCIDLGGIVALFGVVDLVSIFS